MHFKGRIELERGLERISLVPLINIVFLLLIFLMLSSSFVVQSGLRVNLPRLVTSEAVKYENIEIAVSADNHIFVKGNQISEKQLSDFLKAVSGRGQAVLIKSDRHASLGVVAQICDIARENGISQVGIATGNAR